MTDDYRDALITAERDRRDFAQEFFAAVKQRSESAGGLPSLGIHLLLGDTAMVKLRNMVDNVATGRISPVEMIARMP